MNKNYMAYLIEETADIASERGEYNILHLLTMMLYELNKKEEGGETHDKKRGNKE